MPRVGGVQAGSSYPPSLRFSKSWVSSALAVALIVSMLEEENLKSILNYRKQRENNLSL